MQASSKQGASGVTYHVFNEGHQKFLDCRDGEKVTVETWREDSDSNDAPRNWRFQQVAGQIDTFYIINCASSAFLDTHGKEVWVWGDGEDIGMCPANIQWRLRPVESKANTFYIVNVRHSKFLDTHGSSVWVWGDGKDIGSVPANIQWRLSQATQLPISVAPSVSKEAASPCPCIVIGVAGASGCGKSTLSKKLAEVLSASAPIMLDKYFNPAKMPKDKWGKNWETPAGVEFDMLKDEIRSKSQSLAAKARVPVPVLVVEGFLLFQPADLANMCHMRVWIDTDLETARDRRWHRSSSGHIRPASQKDEFDSWYREVVWTNYERYQPEQIKNAGPSLIRISGNLAPEIVYATLLQEISRQYLTLAPVCSAALHELQLPQPQKDTSSAAAAAAP
jgi:uridine kinase